MAPKAWYVLTHESRSEMDADTTSALDYEQSIGKSNGLFQMAFSTDRVRLPWRAPHQGVPEAPRTTGRPPRAAGHGQDGWLGTGCQPGWGGLGRAGSHTIGSGV